MYSHIVLGASNLDESKKFYDAVMRELGYSSGRVDGEGRCFYVTDTGILGIRTPLDGNPATRGNGMTVGFTAKNSAEVDRWHAAGIANGGVSCEDPPGVREDATRTTYLAYLRDPVGNKLCALHWIERRF